MPACQDADIKFNLMMSIEVCKAKKEVKADERLPRRAHRLWRSWPPRKDVTNFMSKFMPGGAWAWTN